jgi:polyvinyl alcohol dehydrogenase (cytochrome)
MGLNSIRGRCVTSAALNSVSKIRPKLLFQLWLSFICLLCFVFTAALLGASALLAPVAMARQAGADVSVGATATAKPARIQAGKNLFGTSCVFCHGQEGRGSGGPSLRGLKLSARQIEAIIANGKPGTAMAAFKNTYSPNQIATLTAYILSLPSNAPNKAAAGQAASASLEEASATGAKIYSAYCASCHEAGGPPYVNRAVLKAATPDYIVYMLASGTMHAQGAALTESQRVAVAEYITGKPLTSSAAAQQKAAAAQCSSPAPQSFEGPEWNGWGVDLDNSRFQPADAAGLAAAQVPALKLKWAFGVPGGFTSYSQPVVVGGRVFIGEPLGGVYSLDAATGCTYWKFQAAAGVRTAITIATEASKPLAYFADLRANVYAVNAVTGKLVWRTKLSDHPYARVTGAPRLYKGALYVPVSSREEWMASDPRYPCCTFRGIMATLDANTGKIIWKTYTISEAARPTTKNKAGTQLSGPSGAGLWSSPTIDEQSRVLYIAAGNNYSDPTTKLSDAVLAFDLKTGKIVWSRQITAGDTYNVSCYRDDHSNCPAKQGPDSDFAAPLILRILSDGRRVLIAGQKSGVVFALDPDKQGEILWQKRIGHGGPLGGVDWGAAADAGTAFVALSDFGMTGGQDGIVPDPKAGGGLFALQLSDGQQAWSAPAAEINCTVPRCSPAQSAAVTAIPGVIFSGAADGHMRAYSSIDGKIIWDFDTVQSFDTVNKIPARGGSIDGGGPAVAGGMVFFSAGYGSLYGIAGNVLLAFGVQ